jgi:hypothetical protein
MLGRRGEATFRASLGGTKQSLPRK